MKRLWTDIHIFKIFLIFFSIVFITFFVYAPFKERISYSIYFWIIYLVGLCFFIYLFLLVSIPKSTYVTDQGIRVGNIPNHIYDYNLFTFTRKAIFLEWDEIKNIKILNKEVNHATIMMLNTILTINSKQGKRYDTFIADPKNFVFTLKSLNKNKLISKSSKFLK